MTTTTTTDTYVTARAKAFSHQGVREHRFWIDADGTVRVWDEVAGHYTTCHCMSAATLRRIRRLAETTNITQYRVYAATTEHGGVHGLGQGDEYYEAATAAEAAQMAADDWGWDADDWDGGDVIVATDDNGDSYHLHRD